MSIKKNITFWVNNLDNYRENLITQPKTLFWYSYPYQLFKAILFLLITIIFILIKIILAIYHSINSVFYLLFCALKQICKKKKKLVRCSSGYLNINTDQPKLTICIDLDNTLIYSSVKKFNDNAYMIDNRFYVHKRPHLDDFLNTASQYCNLIIYTASTQEYADKVIDLIDKNKVILGRYYRSDCVNINSSWYKDVSKYGYDEKDIIIIDDIPQCHLQFKKNIIPIRAWNGLDTKDDSLLKLKNIIKSYSSNMEVGDIVYSSLNNDV